MLKREISYISNYLNKTLKPGQITFNSKILKKELDKDYRRIPIAENPLFQVYYYEYKEENKKVIIFEHKDLPNINISHYLIPKKYEYELDINNDTTSFRTTGKIPYRWLLMLKDFHWKDSNVIPLEEIDFEPLLKEIPNQAFNNIMNSSKSSSSLSIKVNNPNDSKNLGRLKNQKDYPVNYWETFDGYFTPYTKEILEQCNKYECLKPIKGHSNPYKRLYAAEGGIEIFTEEIEHYLKFNHSFPYSGSVRNECKGRSTYRTSKDVNIEELTCLYLALKDLDVDVELRN